MVTAGAGQQPVGFRGDDLQRVGVYERRRLAEPPGLVLGQCEHQPRHAGYPPSEDRQAERPQLFRAIDFALNRPQPARELWSASPDWG